MAAWFQGGSQAPKRSHLGSLWGVFLRYFEVFFVWLFMQHVMSFFKLVVTWGLIFLIKDCQYNAFTLFFMCFSFVYPYSVDVVEAAPPGRAQDHWSCWDMQARSHHLHLCLLSLWMQQLWNNCFYNALALNALPVPLLRQVYFLSVFHLFFCVFFLFVFGGSWRGLLASVGSFGCHLVPILESFSSLFRDRVDLWKRVFY